MAVPTKDLLEFLSEAELQHYHTGFVTTLKVTSLPQLKYVEDEDLAGLGMTKPEIRRLRQFFKKEHPKGAFLKIRKILTKNPVDSSSLHSTISISPPITESQNIPVKHIISEDSISLHKILGTGEFGYVQQGVWTKDTGEQIQVAVKCLPKEMMKTQTSDFLDEATIMHRICHPHIVQLYGVILGTEHLMLVTELAPLKSLLECLKDPAMRVAFPVRHLCDLIYQLADGMAHLEKNRLIHRDLAARNVLVFAEDKVKISDFGLSRALGVGSDYYQGHLNTGLKLPIAWCAPECINFLKFTSASDVWAFGVLLWEMFSYGEQPWTGMTGLEIMQAVDAPNYQRLPQPPKCPDDFYALMADCWKPDPLERPKFADIHANLQQMKPPQVIMLRDTPVDSTTGEDHLRYKTKNVVTVLAKSPSNPPRPGLWRGVVDLTGDVGYFDSNFSSPYIEVVPSNQLLRKIKLNRTESARMSIRNAYKATPNLISRPQNDLRHLGHVGYDGVCFGDLSFIGNNYTELPLKVSSTRRSEDDLRSSRISLPMNGSRLDGGSKMSGFSMSSSILTDNSVLREDDEFADFKLPCFSSEGDSGSSLMEEVLKVLSATTAEDDDEMKGLLAGFESLGLSVDGCTNKSTLLPSVKEGKGQDGPGLSVNTTLRVNEERNSSGHVLGSRSNISVDRSRTVSPASSSSISATYKGYVSMVKTNGTKVEDHHRASSEVSRTTPTNENVTAAVVVDDEDEEGDEEEEEEEEEGSLFESSSLSSGKVSDHYNGLEEEKKSKNSLSSGTDHHSSQSPTHSWKQPQQQLQQYNNNNNNTNNVSASQTSQTSNKSAGLSRFSGDETRRQMETVSSPQPAISSATSIGAPSGRPPSKKSIDSTESLGDSDHNRIAVTATIASPATSFPSSITSSYTSKISSYIPNSSANANRTSLNQKLRVPIIPGRQAPIATTDDDDPAAVDTNPLRRLRQSAGSTGPRPMMTFRPVASGGGAAAAPGDQAVRNINVNASFFDKLKEQQQRQL